MGWAQVQTGTWNGLDSGPHSAETAADYPKEKQPLGGNRNRCEVTLCQGKNVFWAPQVNKDEELLEWL